jgi:hypothetical protein
MQPKPLGNTGLKLSPFGLSWEAAALTGSRLPQQSNWCDLPADVLPSAWERVKLLLPADNFIVQARVGPAAWDDNMLITCQELLTRTGRSSIDLWQLACFDLERIKGGQPFAMMRRLRDAGRIRFFSLRVTGLEDALWSLEHTPVHALTIDAPLVEPEWAELLHTADDAGVGVIATASCVGGDANRAEALLHSTSIASFSWPVGV